MAKQKRNHQAAGFISKALIAAVIVSLLAVTVSAAESGWFVRLFSRGGQTPLSDSQIQLVEEKEQPIENAQTQDQWTVKLQSVMNDGAVGYIILNVSAPEGVDLSEKSGYLDFGNPRILTEPDGVNTAFSGYWADDGDGKDNTRNHVLEVYPDLEFSSVEPFGSNAAWKIHIDKIVQGQREDPKILTDGVWDFSFCFSEGETGIELLSVPIEVQADIPREDTEDAEMTRKTIKITSFNLQPLSARVYYEAEAIPDFWFDGKGVEAVMKDGTSVSFMPGAMNWYDSGYYLMDAVQPVVLEEVDYILFADGTKIPMPE